MFTIYSACQRKSSRPLMTDECSRKIVTEFFGLRSKMYKIRVNGQEFVKKTTGVKVGVVKKKIIHFDDSVEWLRIVI